MKERVLTLDENDSIKCPKHCSLIKVKNTCDKPILHDNMSFYSDKNIVEKKLHKMAISLLDYKVLFDVFCLFL
jgi:hypothetical protein